MSDTNIDSKETEQKEGNEEVDWLNLVTKNNDLKKFWFEVDYNRQFNYPVEYYEHKRWF